MMAWPEKKGRAWRVRYRDADGRVKTLPERYDTQSDALDACQDHEVDTRRANTTRNLAEATVHAARVSVVPAPAEPAVAVTLGEWVARWRAAHRVAPATEAKNDNFLDLKILPAFADWSLADIKRLAVKRWAASLAGDHVHSSVGSFVTLLSTILTAAVDEGLLDHNPIAGMRLPSTHVGKRAPKRPVLSIEQLLEAAERLAEEHGYLAYAQVVTTAYTGMRWGEVCGLARHNVHLEHRDSATGGGWIDVDPDEGSLHEVRGRMWLGPPKSAAAVRRIDVPDFLADILQTVLDAHGHEQLFVTTEGEWHRRSNYSRRVWRPTINGDHDLGWAPIASGSTFHGLRHLHKTILDELELPEVLKHDRMGHRMRGIAAVYSHVTPAMRHQVRTRLQEHWENHTDTSTAQAA